MATPRTEVAQVGAALLAQLLRDEYGVDVVLDEVDGEGEPLTARLSVAGEPALAAVVPVYDPLADVATLQAKAAWEERLAALGVAPCVVWTPPLAQLPEDPGDQYAGRIAQAVASLGESERGEVGFPVTLRVMRDGDEGSYLNALGGLQHHWARFTNQVFGQYRLDSSAIHRLPDDPEETTKLIDLIVLIANGVREVKRTAEVPAEDTWVVQRLPELDGPIVLAAAPTTQPADGRTVRKAVRAGMRDVRERFAQEPAALKLVSFVGIFPALDDESVGIALKGMEPSTFGVMDLACVAVDGRVKRLYGPRAGTALAARQA